MATFKRFEDIEAWKIGRKLVVLVYDLTARQRFAKDWGLRDQLQRAAVSVCSNIAEGYGRRGNKEFVKFLWIAKGSATEVASQMYHAKDLGYVSDDEFQTVYDEAAKISAATYSLIKYLSNDIQRIK